MRLKIDSHGLLLRLRDFLDHILLKSTKIKPKGVSFRVTYNTSRFSNQILVRKELEKQVLRKQYI